MVKRIFIDKDWLYEQYVVNIRSAKDIANEVGCCESNIFILLRKYNISKRCVPYTIDKEWLYNEYVIKKHSTRYISSKIGCTKVVILNRLKKYGIPIRTISESKYGRSRPDIRGNSNPMHREDVICKFKGSNNSTLRNPETYKKVMERMCGDLNPMKNPRNRRMVQLKYTGKGNPNWKGGLMFLPYCHKFNDEFKRRVRTFFNNECIICGKSSNDDRRELCVHHVDYNKQTCCDDSKPCFAALCQKCHCRTNQNRSEWEYIFHRIIDELYNGKSFYTREEYNIIMDVEECL